MKQLSNYRRALIGLKNQLRVMETRLDIAIEEIDKIKSMRKSCPRCYSGDLRVMKNNIIFCRGCGFSNRKKGLSSEKKE